MSIPRKTTTTPSSTSSIPIPARITAKSTIPRPPASSAPKVAAAKPTSTNASRTSSTSTSPSKITSTSKSTVSSTASTVRARTTSTRTVGGNTLPVPPSPAARNNKTPSPSKTRPIPLSPSRNRSVSPSPLPIESQAAPLSIREAIALKRAEAKKAQLSKPKAVDRQKSFDNFSNPNEVQNNVVDEVELSRWSIRESIERARTSGTLNLASRSLHSIPSALYEIHLGITPEPLKDVPEESEEILLVGKAMERKQAAWFEAVDLTVMKLRDNMIIEIQPEISLFGSLKTLELRNNRLKSLPNSITDLVNLVTLDVSANHLTSLPPDIATLPLLTTLDVSSNELTSLPLTVISTPLTSPITTSFFSPVAVERASRPLPSLRHLLASHNQIPASALPKDDLPPELHKIDLSHNPLANGNENIKAAKQFFQSVSKLPKLKQFVLEASQLDDGCFDFAFSPSLNENRNIGKNEWFGALELLDLGKTKVTEKVETIFSGRAVSFEGVAIEGGVRIILGANIQKEAWEIEAERRTKRPQTQTWGMKEDWEIKAEAGLNTQAGQRRARMNLISDRLPEAPITPDMPPTPPKSPVSPLGTTSTYGNGQSLAHCYTSSSQTLTLPRALPPGHNRSRSLAATSSMSNNRSDPTVPVQTLPLPLILVQPFAKTLTRLILSNRRADASFVVPEEFFASLSKNSEMEADPYFPYLEELRLDGCFLSDGINITTSAQTRKEPLLNVINHLFPTLSILDLCENRLTHVNGIDAFLIPSNHRSSIGRRRKGLKALYLRGNKLADLTGLEDVATVLRKEGKTEEWSLEELDLRENEISKLPPILGFLPVDVMLVEGNMFRVPARRVWEVDGTKGLLGWLRGRADP